MYTDGIVMEVKSLDYYVMMEHDLIKKGKKGNGRRKTSCSRYARITKPLSFPVHKRRKGESYKTHEERRADSYEIALLYLRFHLDFDELSVNDHGRRWERHFKEDERFLKLHEIMSKIKRMARIASRDRKKFNFMEAKFVKPGTEDEHQKACIGFIEHGDHIISYEAAVPRDYEDLFTIKEEPDKEVPEGIVEFFKRAETVERPLSPEGYAYTNGLWVPKSFDAEHDF
jgi:hypothetical protein